MDKIAYISNSIFARSARFSLCGTHMYHEWNIRGLPALTYLSICFSVSVAEAGSVEYGINCMYGVCFPMALAHYVSDDYFTHVYVCVVSIYMYAMQDKCRVWWQNSCHLQENGHLTGEVKMLSEGGITLISLTFPTAFQGVDIKAYHSFCSWASIYVYVGNCCPARSCLSCRLWKCCL